MGSEVISMTPKIVTKEAFKVVGMEIKTNLVENKIPKLWMDFMPRMGEIKNQVNPKVAYGFCISDTKQSHNTFTKETIFSAIAAIEVSSTDDVPKGMVSKKIDSNKYVVFTHKGELSNLGKTYDYIYKEWLPKSGYESELIFDFELYDERFNYNDQKNSEIDIYVPIK